VGLVAFGQLDACPAYVAIAPASSAVVDAAAAFLPPSRYRTRSNSARWSGRPDSLTPWPRHARSGCALYPPAASSWRWPRAAPRWVKWWRTCPVERRWSVLSDVEQALTRFEGTGRAGRSPGLRV